MTSKGERPSCRAQSSRASWMRARVQKAAQGLATLVAIATAFTFAAHAADYAIIDSATALALGGASGGDEIRRIENDDGTFDLVHIFTNTASSQTFTIPAGSKVADGNLQVLVVGGGGAGSGNCGGGGGAGGLIYTNLEAVAAGDYPIQIGAGGKKSAGNALGGSGSNTTFTCTGKTFTALGGGRGGNYGSGAGAAGGSGGGACGGGSVGEGNQPNSEVGGFGNAGGKGAGNNRGGGGGGANGPGSAAVDTNGGAGGPGLEYDISGESVVYAAGGGGAGYNGGTAGAAGGSTAGAGTPGATNLTGGSATPGSGSGGGGAAGGGGTSYGGAGGSGIVVIRYTVTPKILEDGSLLYTYTLTNYVDQLTLPKAALARLLLVGGGGAGANAGAISTSQGGAGGGGAGGMIDRSDFVLESGVYNIYVGKGGEMSGTTRSVGESGHPTVITNATTGTEVLLALGGGGGGILTKYGLSGGSGGGGSLSGGCGSALQPDSVYGGYGNRGGTSSYARAGAGGGGACDTDEDGDSLVDGIGGSPTAVNVGGAGGAGKKSNITGSPVDYAAGGGGGVYNGTAFGLGGSNGIGGNGGGTGSPAGHGRDGTGSGGGGSVRNGTGGRGGSGIVYIRIFRYMPDKPVDTNFTYTGAIFAAYAEDSYAEKAYTLEGTYEASAVGNYTFTATLKPGFCWGDGSTGSVEVNWQILPKQLDISSFTMAGWQIGEETSEPALVSDPVVFANEVTYYYSSSSSDWSAATTDKPTTVGTWFVKPVFDSNNFSTNGLAIPVASFSLWSWNADKYPTWAAYHVDLTDTRYTGTTPLTNFPVLVRVNKSILPSFYDQCQADGSDVRFTHYDEATGTVTDLPFEVNVWNPDGESSWWVKVPEYKANSYVATLNWGVILDEDEEGNRIERALPANDPTQVWSGYAGVWHFNEEIDSSHAGTQKSGDATGGGNDAEPARYSTKGDLSVMVSTNGVFGNARVNGVYGNGSGNDYTLLKVADFDNAQLGSCFTFSGWISQSQVESNPRIVSTKTAQNATAEGWEIDHSMTRSQVRVFGYGNTVAAATVASGSIKDQGFLHITVVYNGTSASVFAHGPNTGDYVTEDLTIAEVTATTGLAFGGNLSAARTFWGAFDEFRMKVGETTADWALAEYQQARLGSGGDDATGLTVGPVLVTPESKFANRWIVDPSFSASELNQGTDPFSYLSRGAAVYGTPTNAYYTVGGTEVADITTAPAGTYTVKVWVEAGEWGTCRWAGLEPFEFTFTFVVIQPYTILGTNVVTRILLGNDDTNPLGPVTNQQSYALSEDDGGLAYWVHQGDYSSADYPYLKPGATNMLYSATNVAEICGGTLLWYLEDVRLGNKYGNGMEMITTFNYLPHSSTATDVSYMVMRNVEGAAIYSPCYTNGIGTIYFDAVNSWTTIEISSYNPANNAQIEVQICTNPEYSTISVPSEIPASEWKTVTLHPLLTEGNGKWEALAETQTLGLSVTTGNRDDVFYRVYAEVDADTPVRFRIVRKSARDGQGYDGNCSILIDNVIASHPAMRVDLAPYYGDVTYDASRTGEAVLGWAGSFDVPLPGVGDALKGRARTTVSGGALGQAADTAASGLVANAQLWYRWRYLAQETVPEEGWRSVSLDPLNGFASNEALTLPDGRRGDVEFYFTARLSAPYYDYVDYSGLGLGLGGFYTENIASVTNALNSVGRLESGGTNWFVRLRDGASNYADVTLEVVSYAKDGVTATATNEYAMAVTGAHTWRGYYPTPTNRASRIGFRLAAKDAQEQWATEWASNVTYYVEAETNTVPISSTVHAWSGGEDDEWTKIPVDAATGYLLFQFDDESKSLNVVHADYQNFNVWTDANQGQLFVGTTNDYSSAKMSGTSAAKRTDEETFAGWEAMPTAPTNGYWTVPSAEWKSFSTYSGGNKPYETFKSDVSGAWAVGSGMWVNKHYKDDTTTDGIALLMDGGGDGYISLTDTGYTPRGIDTINFNARLAQSIGINDFSYYFGANMLTLSNYVFTAGGSFDRNENKDFRGNASLSLLAHYVPGRGAYEFRIEQYAAKNSGAAANEKSQIVSLYKWNSRSATLLTCQTNTAYAIAANKSDASVYTPLFISVSNATDGVWIFAGRGMPNSTNTDKGTIGSAASTSGKNYFVIGYKDTSAPCRTGTYGVLTSNCPGDIHNPYVFPQPLPPTQLQTTTITPSATLMWSNKVLTFPGTAQTCHGGIKAQADAPDCLWYTEPGRMTTYNTSGSMFGFRGTNETQKLTLFTAPNGKSNWTAVTNVTVTGFGSATALAKYTLSLRTPESVSVKLATAEDGDSDAAVVIDSFEMTQWAGADYKSYADAGRYIPTWTSLDTYRAHTNFVFTTGLIQTNGAGNAQLLLSAKRTPSGSPASVRTPLYDGLYGRGKGLGMIAFDYLNAQTNVNLLVQIATNVDYSVMTSVDTQDARWHTVTNISFAGADAATLASGTKSVYLGQHGIQGLARVLLDPEVVNAATNATDESAFGNITITRLLARDEPALDMGCWWGWNLRTVGDDDDTEGRMTLADYSQTSAARGLSLALNDAIDHDIVAADADAYRQHQPFLQTPTFLVTNATFTGVGEVSFRARMYGANANAADAADQWASVQLYGAVSGEEASDAAWTKVGEPIIVSNLHYRTYSYKTAPNENYRAFRLAVTGVSGLTGAYMPGGETVQPSGYASPVRVLLDEVLVSEAIRARVGFRNVGFFATRDGICSTSSDAVVTVISDDDPAAAKAVQPLWKEGWGVQCEIWKAQLPDEIDFETPGKEPEVYLHWFKGEAPWGYENWKTNAAAQTHRLMPAAETNYVYRSSYLFEDGQSVVPQSLTPGEVVQFSLEVRYYQTGAAEPISSTLARGEWKNPPWYAPVDKNAGRTAFAAYNILDSVAPGWAWINEVNIFGQYEDYVNTESDQQFVEIAAPAEADLTNWYVQFICANKDGATAVTNVLGQFGTDTLPGTKAENAISNMVFRCLCSPGSKAKLTSGAAPYDYSGTVDADWGAFLTAHAFKSTGTLYADEPFGIQLVRPSGIVEHEIAVIGTNDWLRFEYEEYEPANFVRYLNTATGTKEFFFAGQDNGGTTRSLGVVEERGETDAVWSAAMKPTPGKINEGQQIASEHPTPSGETLIVYAYVDNEGGHIVQTVGDAVKSAASQILYLKRGAPTNITYTVDRWYELTSVTTNDVALALPTGTPIAAGDDQGKLEYVVTVGEGLSNSFTVVAAAQIGANLRTNFGLTPENRYTPAVMKWLLDGTTLKGAFHNPYATEPLLAEFLPLNNPNLPGRPMSLTEMYWLDIDPTEPWDADATKNALALRAGMADAPQTAIGDYDGLAVTNVKFAVQMMITNRNEGAGTRVWAPYTLRGLAPGETVQNNPGNWTSATFQVLGFLANGRTSFETDWEPLRWFVFDEYSFDENFKSSIEVWDPHSTASPAYTYWGDWFKTYGTTAPIFYRWTLQERGGLIDNELLNPTNYYDSTH